VISEKDQPDGVSRYWFTPSFFPHSKVSGEVMAYNRQGMHKHGGSKAVLTKPGKIRSKSAKKASFKKGK